MTFKIKFFSKMPGEMRPNDVAILQHALSLEYDDSLENVYGIDKRLWEVCQERYELVDSPEEADYFLAPMNWHIFEPNDAIIEFAKQAERYSKKIVIFSPNDCADPLPIENAIVFRTSAYKSQCDKDVHGMAGFYFTTRNEVPPRKPLMFKEKGESPLVGFCGFLGAVPADVRNPFDRFYKLLIQKLLINDIRLSLFLKKRGITVTRNVGFAARSQVIHLCQKAKGLKTNFLFRKKFHDGSREEYVRNIQESDYVLCPRGAGNFSFRFYETLALGRIPIFVNTDCLLPYEEYISWKDYVVWVEEEELPQLEQKVLEFHNALTKDAFIEKQKACNELWEKWLSPHGYFDNLYRYLQKD